MTASWCHYRLCYFWCNDVYDLHLSTYNASGDSLQNQWKWLQPFDYRKIDRFKVNKKPTRWVVLEVYSLQLETCLLIPEVFSFQQIF